MKNMNHVPQVLLVVLMLLSATTSCKNNSREEQAVLDRIEQQPSINFPPLNPRYQMDVRDGNGEDDSVNPPRNDRFSSGDDAPVPEPTTMLILGGGLAMYAASRKKNNRS